MNITDFQAKKENLNQNNFKDFMKNDTSSSKRNLASAASKKASTCKISKEYVRINKHVHFV